MKVPLVDLTRQYRELKDEIDGAVSSVLERGVFILGDNVRAFEAEMASYCQSKFAVGVASGSDALELSLAALGIGEGDEVITTPFTFIATAEAICVNGAKPVFADIELDTYNISPAAIEERITERTKAIIPVHLFGHPCDMDAILSIAKKDGLKVIEDCAQSIGAKFNSGQAGTFGDVGCFSFFPSKNLGCYGDGGIVVTDEEEIAERLKMLRVHGSTDKYHHEIEGRNSRLDELQAAILRVKLKYLDKSNEARRRNAKLYDRLFEDSEFDSKITTPVERKGCAHVYNIYSIRTNERERLKDFLASKGVSTAVYYPLPLHLQRVYKFLGHKKGNFPNSEKVAQEILALPVFPELRPEEPEFVVDCVKSFLTSASQYAAL